MLYSAKDWKLLNGALTYALLLIVVPLYFFISPQASASLVLAMTCLLLAGMGLSWLDARDMKRDYKSMQLGPNPYELPSIWLGVILLAAGSVLFMLYQTLWMLIPFYLLAMFWFYAGSLRLTNMVLEGLSEQQTKPD